ncbi:SDR family oxidoreductase [Agromyces sp. H66]|uniref:SDR family oxidoreductase n=1 Tax=Agromyces sp. H66 TaxID=2529859 RepID=UPI0010A9D19A|nr:SDR family oxidoreductase [Agromyces sp. H66]
MTTSSAPILVTGGTGTLGRAVVRALTARGDDVRVLSRSGAPGTLRGDLATGEGVEAALDGVRAVLHLATTLHDDTAITRTLVRAAERTGRPRIMYQSIVGIDRIPLGFYAGKRASERLVAESRLRWTILRATQFHDLVALLFRVQRFSPVVFAPAFSFQSIAVEDVARRWVELLDADAAGMVPDIGGPEVRTARDLARAYLAAHGSRRPTLPFRLPGSRFTAFASGANLVPGEPYGRITFEDFLASRGDIPVPRDPRGTTDA